MGGNAGSPAGLAVDFDNDGVEGVTGPPSFADKLDLEEEWRMDGVRSDSRAFGSSNLV